MKGGVIIKPFLITTKHAKQLFLPGHCVIFRVFCFNIKAHLKPILKLNQGKSIFVNVKTFLVVIFSNLNGQIIFLANLAIIRNQIGSHIFNFKIAAKVGEFFEGDVFSIHNICLGYI